MLYCKKCGLKLEDDALFCHKCGTPAPKEEKTAEGLSEAPTNTNATEETSRQTALHANVRYGTIDLNNLPKGHVIEERYEIIKKIGQGAFGAVYLAYDRKLKTNKALKILADVVSNDREAIYRISEETAIMIKLNHPNIVRVYDFHDKEDIKFIDMEYIEGESLSELKLKKEELRFTEEEVKEYAKQILRGVGYAHKEKVIHKDIKPQNIMLTKSGEIKIMDFGIAETLRNSVSRLNNTTSSGTLVYMSPEQLRGKGVGKESDIYSIGATLYELLRGNPPFYTGDVSYQILNEEVEKIEGVSEELNEILLKTLRRDYRERYRSCEEMLEAIEVENNKNLSK